MVGDASRGGGTWIALPFVLPFLVVYGALFVYPTLQMLWMSLTDGQLIRQGDFVGLDNYLRLLRDWRFSRAILNTGWFLVLTVVPGTVAGLVLALGVDRLRGRGRRSCWRSSSCPTSCRSRR